MAGPAARTAGRAAEPGFSRQEGCRPSLVPSSSAGACPCGKRLHSAFAQHNPLYAAQRSMPTAQNRNRGLERGSWETWGPGEKAGAPNKQSIIGYLSQKVTLRLPLPHDATIYIAWHCFSKADKQTSYLSESDIYHYY